MTLRLGFVGCGKWGRKLAESFRACGAEIVAFDRKKPEFKRADPLGMQPGEVRLDTALPLDGFGEYQPWWEQIKNPRIDAIIAVAPPEITTQVALECARQGKAVMATKPLFDHPETIRAPFYVDFWRLCSRAHSDARQGDIYAPVLELYGPGPFRSFPGSLDYGPHVLAAALDVAERQGCTLSVESAKAEPCETGELFTVLLRLDERRTIAAKFGNGATVSRRSMWGAEEAPSGIGGEGKDVILQRFCQSFIDDVTAGFVDTRLLNLSRDSMRLLGEIRARAT